MRLDVLTLFPEMFPSYLGQSLLKRAIERGLVDVQLHNIRDWTTDKHNSVDDRPFGGGPGMVLMAPPVVECVEDIQQQGLQGQQGQKGEEAGHLVMLSPQGRRLTQPVVEELASHKRILLICGRYEGFDQRISDILKPDEISIGDYVLNGGEVAAMVVIDSVIRLVPGVLGDEESSRQDSFSLDPQQLEGQRLEGQRLEFEQYTRPREYRGHQVPDVLLSGDHGRIAEWRQQQSLERTKQRRADLLGPQEKTS